MKEYKILCLDDEKKILDIYQMMLEDTGFEIVTFSSTLKALDFILLNSQSIIYIFSDYQVDKFNGIEFRELVNEMGDDIPFTMVTGFFDLTMAQKAMALKISSFVEKPFQAEELKKLINDLGLKRKNALDKIKRKKKLF